MVLSGSSLIIALVAATIVIIISYVLLLVKLKPSIRKEEHPLPKKPRISVKPQERPKEPTTKVEDQKVAQAIAHPETAEAEEKREPKEETDERKSFFLFGERNFEGCSRRFGFLSSLPKNTPIPDDCFGCPQIIECLRALDTK